MIESNNMDKGSAKIVPVVHKFNLAEQPTDFAYWQSQPYAARLAALEAIRREYIAWKYDSSPGFQRVYTIIKR